MRPPGVGRVNDDGVRLVPQSSSKTTEAVGYGGLSRLADDIALFHRHAAPLSHSGFSRAQRVTMLAITFIAPALAVRGAIEPTSNRSSASSHGLPAGTGASMNFASFPRKA